MPLIKRMVDDEFDQDRYYDSSDEELWYGYEEEYYGIDPEEEIPEPDPPDYTWHRTPQSSYLTKSSQAIHVDPDSEDLYPYSPRVSQVPKKIVTPPAAPRIQDSTTSTLLLLQQIEERLSRLEASLVMHSPAVPSPVPPQCHDPGRVESLGGNVATTSSDRELPTRSQGSIPPADDVNKLSLASSRESKDIGQVICREPPMSKPLLDHTLGLRLVSSQRTNLRESIDLEVVEEPQATLPEDDAHPPEPSTKPCEWLMEELPCSNNSGLNIHSETPHFEDFGRSKMCMERVSYGEDQKLIRTSERLGQRPPGEVSDRSFPLGFNISRQNISGEEMGRVRLSLRGLPTSLVHEPLIRLSREPWELLAEGFARSFPIGFNIHRVTMYLEDLDRARITLKILSEDLVHKALPEACSEPWKEHSGETTRSISPTLEIHSQVEYVKGFDRSRTCDFRVPFAAVQHKLHGYEHRGKELTCSYSACLSASGFIFYRQSVYGKVNDRGETNLVRAPLNDHPYTTIETERQKEPTSHSHSSRLGSMSFLICSENTYKEVFGQGKLSLDQFVLRDGPQGPVPPYTGRTDLSTPSGHWNHYPCVMGHVTTEPTRPLEPSASTSFVASASRPRTLPCDLTGEVLSFSLKLLLFPFDPGKRLEIFPHRCC